MEPLEIKLTQTLKQIQPVDAEAMELARKRWDSIAKPLHSLGLLEDPIPAARGMEYTYGLYYRDPEDGQRYLCQRTGEAEGGKVVLQYLPHELVGQYFALA